MPNGQIDPIKRKSSIYLQAMQRVAKKCPQTVYRVIPAQIPEKKLSNFIIIILNYHLLWLSF